MIFYYEIKLQKSFIVNNMCTWSDMLFQESSVCVLYQYIGRKYVFVILLYNGQVAYGSFRNGLNPVCQASCRWNQMVDQPMEK